jgi:aminoglycoside phosphotransferase family enzyme/predicted kinase
MTSQFQSTNSSASQFPGGSYEETVRLLLKPETYPECPSAVDHIETHISSVFLTDRYAYKLKKTVTFDFLDFSTAQARHDACQEEVRLNRRLAGDVYLGVVPITLDDRGELHLDGRGLCVDWVVKMRRLDTRSTLEELIRQGRLTDSQIASLASLLASFYVSAPPLVVRPEEYRRTIENHVRANRRELLDAGWESFGDASLSFTVRRIHTAQLRFLERSAGLFEARVSDGRIIDGHGDLRPEHICLSGTPVVFDCIEFNAEFRRIDVIDEIAFLIMECELLGDAAAGWRVMDAYQCLSGDMPSMELLNFYLSYRACVRAKVAVLRSRQMEGEQRQTELTRAGHYLKLAERYSAELGQPVALIVGGLMGTGKSTLAAGLAERIGAELLQTDEVRREIFGASLEPASYGTGVYSAENRAQVYQVLFQHAADWMRHEVSVVLDGTFSTDILRRTALKIACEHGAEPLLVWCHCPAQTARERIAARQARGECSSEARPELFDQQQFDADAVHVADLPVCEVDTTLPLAAQIHAALAVLNRFTPQPQANPARSWVR